MSESNAKTDLLKMTTQLVGSYVSNHTVTPDQISSILQQVYSSLINLHEGSRYALRSMNLKPAVPIEESVHDSYIVCLEDGKKLQMLKRHIKTVYNMTVDQYKARWNLPPEYPVVSPDYAKRRSAIAKSSGLGQAGRRRRFSDAA
jgi:predicted transcriptional regulator